MDYNDELLGKKVRFTATFNNPGHYKPGDKILGTIISVFTNWDGPIFRIRLDLKWNERVASFGKEIIIGNISSSSIFVIS